MIRIKELRQKAGILQKDLASDLNIGFSTLCQYETGKREPDLHTIEKIANYFNVSVDYLLGRSDEKRPAIREDDEPAADEILVRSRNGQIVKKQYTEKQMKLILKLIDSIEDEDLDL